ncbi:leucine zipper-ef-hand containing transmembrane protein, putative [Perkinsus marinus ATCC 50983]|uniref:Leucine zipper-ef-hand containing transmembrane protein, putative n=1 Tax=Perkinsus marinus (strain ATCC 50983 / TXsc) TaxID=423536 RepID=C5KJL6_PERM5|nr:leucine zipper-ef-hand containing transmembrane protein, putative [Perkinsus marinus ATCC 50983]EER15350.1 leucine zipper-ef-hand containing transmembrane protein, putative [Perkinsus marinus ATCC 50983]|eukprot:XP_002783554.1 leucine zipper-ef-hand containing transmembrane protein, putative [Perkinsus marinus ATCC 50983]
MSAWVKNGSKLFGKNVQLSTQLVMKQARGYQLTLREHKLLVRTVTDLFKLVPFSLFIIIPFAELALPIALRLFPNMLPSTFSDKKSDHAQLMRRMKAKGDMAGFFNEVIAEKNKQILEEQSSKFRFSKLFHSEFQLEQMSVEQLRAICAMLGLRPYAFKSHIVLQLRHYVTRLRSEDRDILWEGVNNLSHAELAEANRMRGMPYVNVDDDRLRAQLSSWLEVSSNKDIPVSLLLWSRTFFMAQQPGTERERLVSELNNT